MRARISHLNPLVTDVALVLIVWAANSLTISAASDPGTRDPDAFAYGLGLLMAIPLLGRRRWPVGTLVATALVISFYFNLDYPGFVPAVPFAVPLYTVSLAGGLGWAWA